MTFQTIIENFVLLKLNSISYAKNKYFWKKKIWILLPRNTRHDIIINNIFKWIFVIKILENGLKIWYNI